VNSYIIPDSLEEFSTVFQSDQPSITSQKTWIFNRSTHY